MKYNVFISTKGEDYTLGNLLPEDLKDVINAYDNGLNSFVINGEKYFLNNFLQIKVFEIEKENEFNKYWDNDRREVFQTRTKWQPKILEKFGKDVTRDFIGNKDIGNNVGIKKIFDSEEFTTYFWNNLNPTITKVSRERFDNKQYADAVEAAFKELNDIIKQEYKTITGIEDDGKSMMMKAFSIKNPIFTLVDISDSNGQNIQEGYMHIFGGAMQGIRNPKAHKNLVISEKDAIEKLFLASHLMRMFEDKI